MKHTNRTTKDPTTPSLSGPKRIKIQHHQGWRIGDAKYVGKPSRWAVPKEFHGSKQEIICQYETWIMNMSEVDREAFLAPLRGRDLVCYCEPDQICHADVLLRLANAKAPKTE